MSLAANYQLTAADRRRIDDQIVGMQRHLAQGLLRGQTRSYFKLAADSVSLAKGDLFCVAAVEVDETDANTAVRTVTRADSIALTASGVVLGIAATPASPGATFQGITDGIVGRAITGLASGAAGAVRATSARCERVASFGGSDYAVGFVDAVGNLTLSQTAAGAAVGGGASLSNSNPVPLANSAAPGVATEAARIDHAHARPANATTSTDGYHSATDKGNHDTIWGSGHWVNPSGVYATDETALNNAAVLNRLLGKPILLGPGQFNVRANQVDWSNLNRCHIEGRGASAPNSASTVTDGTTIKVVTQIGGVSQRAAGSWLVDVTGSQNCTIEGIHFKGGDENAPDGAVETCVKGILDGVNPQTGSVHFNQCAFTGTLTHVATSTASRTLAMGTITFPNVTGKFPDNSIVVVRSNGGGAIGIGIVTPGTGGTLSNQTLSVTFSKVRNDGTPTSHTDWRIHQGTEGLNLFGSGNCSVTNCIGYSLYRGIDASAAIALRVEGFIASGGSFFGPQVYGDSTSYGCDIDIVTEYGIDNWACGAEFLNSRGVWLHMCTGDAGFKGHLIELSSCVRTTVTGAIEHVASNAAAIRADGTTGLDVWLGNAVSPVLVGFFGQVKFLTGNPTLTFSGNTITRSSGSWTTDGFGPIGADGSAGTVTFYNSTSNNVTRNVVSVSGGGTILTVDGAALTAETSANVCATSQIITVVNERPVIDCPSFEGGSLFQGVEGTSFRNLAWRDNSGVFQHTGSLAAVKMFSIFGVRIPFVDVDCSSGVGLGPGTANMHVTTSGGTASIATISPTSDPGVYAYLQAQGYFGAEAGAGVGALTLRVVHDGNFTCTLVDTNSTNGVRTGTGGNVVLPACTGGARYVVELVYYPGIARWVVAHIYGPAGGDVTGWLGSLTIANSAVTNAKLAASAVTDAKVDNAAAIAGTKIAPDFGSQNIVTTGTVSGATPTLAAHLTRKDYVDAYAVQTEADDGNSGTADTIAFTLTSSFHKSTATGNCTYTYTFPSSVGAFVHEIYQDGTGGHTSALSSNIKNKTAIESILNANTVAGTVCVVSYVWNGTFAVGSVVAAGVTP